MLIKLEMRAISCIGFLVIQLSEEHVVSASVFKAKAGATIPPLLYCCKSNALRVSTGMANLTFKFHLSQF